MDGAPQIGFLGREPVLTPDGPVPIHELRAGDLVLSRAVTPGADPEARTEVVAVRILATHLLPDTHLGAFNVGNHAAPDAVHEPILLGARQTFWVPAEGRWEHDFSDDATEPDSADGGRRVIYSADRAVYTTARDDQATLETYRGSDDDHLFTLDALGVTASTRGVFPPKGGSETWLRWPTHHLTVDETHAFFVTDEGLLASDFTGG